MSLDRKELREVFDQFDADKSGSLEIPEILKLCEKIEANTTEEKLNKLFKEIDMNEDGKVSFEEFLAWYRVGRTTDSATFLRNQIRIQNQFNNVFKNMSKAPANKEDIDNIEVLNLSIRDRSGAIDGSYLKFEVLLGSRNTLLRPLQLAFPEFDPKQVYVYLSIRTDQARQLTEEINNFLVNMTMALEEINPELQSVLDFFNIMVSQINSKVYVLFNPQETPIGQGLGEVLLQAFQILTDADPKISLKLMTGSTIKNLVSGVKRGTNPQNSKISPNSSNLLRLIFEGMSLNLRVSLNDYTWRDARKGGMLNFGFMDSSKNILPVLNTVKMNLCLNGADNYEIFKGYFDIKDGHIPDVADLADDIGKVWSQMGEYLDQFPFVEDFFEALRAHAICDTEIGFINEAGRVLLGFRTDGIDDLYDLIVSGFE